MKTITQLFFLFACTVVGFSQTTTTALIDFGNTEESGDNYNNVTGAAVGSEGSIVPIINSDGTTTGITLTIDNEFNGTNGQGTQMAGEDVPFVSTATGDSFYGAASVAFGGLAGPNPNAGFTLTGLEADLYYSFTIFASRAGVTTVDNRSTLYTIAGGGDAKTASLNATNNVDQLAVIENVQADENGAISFTAEPNQGVNNNTSGFYYLGAIEMVISDQVLSTESAVLSNSLAVYPNPVSSRAQITFDLKEQSNLKINVYDLSGRLVENIVNGEQPAGKFSTTWDRSSNIASGVYILQIDANGKRSNSKLLLK